MPGMRGTRANCKEQFNGFHTTRNKHNEPPAAEQISKTDHMKEPGSDYWDGFDEDKLREIEENALKQVQLKKSQASQDAAATSRQENPEVGSKEVNSSSRNHSGRNDNTYNN
jgi:hypothetical protein